MNTNIVTTTWTENSQFKSDNPSGHEFYMDVSSAHGGQDSGMRPKALMLSSLAGCSGVDVVALLKKMRVVVDDFKIIVTGELTEEHPKFYHKVKVVYVFNGLDLDEEKIHKAVNLSVDKYCGVMEMFRQFATVEIAISINKKA